MNRKHQVQTGLQIFAETEPRSREDAGSVWRAIFAQLALVHNHGVLVLWQHTLRPSWGGSIVEQTPASIPTLSKLLARIVSYLRDLKWWYRDGGKKLFATLCSIAMVLYILGAIALAAALLIYTLSH
jgi:hypothetical protein